MNKENSRQENVTERFWGKYVKYIVDQGVKQTTTRWYVVRVEQYIKAFPKKKLAEHGPIDVVGYLEEQGRLGRIKDWQFRQVVDAIQNLFAMLGASRVSEVDWKY